MSALLLVMSPKTRPTPRVKEYLQAEDVRKLLSTPYPANVRDRLVLRFLASTGCRVTEMLRVRWRDVNLTRKEESVRIITLKQKQHVAREVLIDDEELVVLLRTYREEVEDEDQLIFQITRQAVTAMVKRYALLAQVGKNSYAHILRHTYIVQRLKEGVDLRTIQRQVGHARLETTAVYLNLINTDLRDQLERGRLPW